MKWKDYTLRYCLLCGTISIGCHDENCHGSSCNGGGCKLCHNDFVEFHKWSLTTEAKRKERWLKVVAYLRHIWYVLFKWDKNSRTIKSIFGYWSVY